MKINKKNPRHLWLLLQQWLYTMLAVIVRPMRRKTGTRLVVLYGHQFSGNLKALYFEALRAPHDALTFAYLTLDPEHADALEAAGIRVLRCNRIADMLQLSTTDAMITDHGLHLMSPLLRWTDITFIDVWHGIPFKGFIPGDFRLQHRYDEVWVSSPLLKAIYERQFGFEPGRVVSLGYARTDPLFQAAAAAHADSAADAAPPKAKTVLFAPTWKQDSQGRDMFPFGETPLRFLQEIAEICGRHGATLVVRAHQNAVIEDVDSNAIVFCSQRDEPDTEKVLLGSDVLICDWSSIAFDYLALNRPTIFLDVTPPFKHGFSLGPEYRFGQIAHNFEQLKDSLARYLDKPDRYSDEFGDRHREVTAALYADETCGNAARLQIARLQTLLAR